MPPAADRVAHPPPRPLMVWDGDCHFCGMWIRRWQRITGDKVDYASYQVTGNRFPEVTEADYARAVHLILPDGRVQRGAEAVFETLNLAGHKLGAWLYRRVPPIAWASRLAYRTIARHRMLASFFTRMIWGDPGVPSSYRLSGMLFPRLVGLVFLIAFVSFWSQADGLVGDHGLQPVSGFYRAIEDAPKFTQDDVPYLNELLARGYDYQLLPHLDWSQKFWIAPSLLWLSPDSRGLEMILVLGTAGSVLAMAGLLPGWALLGCVLAYGSLRNGVPMFLSYQWDVLLVETGLTSLLFAPWGGRLRFASLREPPRAGRWLAWWLLFKLMFLSGFVKIITNDVGPGPQHPGWFRHFISAITDVPVGKNTWLDGTALQYHYFTQPIPAWTSWYADHLPAWFQSGSLWACMFIEIVVPFAFFGPRRLRHAAAILQILLQIALMASGNYGFFNVLTIVLCVPLLDDSFWPRRVRERLGGPAPAPPPATSLRRALRRSGAMIRWTVAALVFLIGLVDITHEWERRTRAVSIPAREAGILDMLAQRATQLSLVNSYGLFRVMTTERPELVFVGSNDGQNWLPYEFKWKPGDPARAPSFTGPNMPRLDWDMWFAALDLYYGKTVRPSVMLLKEQLERGNPAVLALLEKNPFPDAPPKMVRVQMYKYRFTTPEERAKTGDWWTRERVM